MTFVNKTCVTIIAACLFITAPLSAADYKQITKKADFMKIAVDKNLVAKWGWIRAGSDGRMTGKTGGDSISGTWQWKGRYFCRKITFGDTNRSGCISVHVSGDDIVFILDEGKGQQVPMKIR